MELQSNLGKLFLTSHLGMTGAWLLDKGDHVHVIISYKDHNKIRKLYYDDIRKFGDFHILTPEEMQVKLDKLGLDVLSPTFNLNAFKTAMLKYPNKRVADVLIDQSILAGIGNWLRADILYKCSIHPLTLVKNIHNWSVLFNAIKHIAEKSYSEGGSSGEFRNLYGQTGYYDFLVYNKEKDPHGNPVKILKMNGRSVYYSPVIQKL